MTLIRIVLLLINFSTLCSSGLRGRQADLWAVEVHRLVVT